MQATIVRSGPLLQITPSYKAILAPYLSYEKRTQQGGNSKSVVYEKKNLYIEENGSLIVPMGFYSKVCNILQNLGVVIKFEDLRVLKLPEPSYENIDPLRAGQEDILSLIIALDCGVIEAPTAFGKSFVIQMICKLWPTANIIICSPFSGIIRQTYEELKTIMRPGEVGMVGDGMCETESRVQCVIDKSLLKCNLDACDIFLFDEVHRAAAPKTAEAISYVGNAKRFGFSASPYGRGDNADLETEGMFGPRIFSLDYQTVQATGSIVPIEVYNVDTSLCAPMDNFYSTSVMKRNALWRNVDRNNLIAKSVSWSQAKYGEDVQTLITVETVEHAVHLGKLLPDFQLVYASMDGDKRERWERDKMIPLNTHPISPKQREQFRKDFESGSLRRAIATGVWGTGLNFKHLTVLIRADAQSGSIQNTQIPGRVTRSADGKEVGIVIDFDDVFCKTLKNKCSKRLTAYRKKGWTIQPLQLATYTRN